MVLTVNNKNEVVFGKRDFSFLIEKYMGDEAKRYYDDLISDYEREIEDLTNGEKYVDKEIW